MHHRRPLGEVGTEPDPVGVGDSYASRHDVVEHARKLVEPIDPEMVVALGECSFQLVDTVREHRPRRCPGDVGEHAEDSGEVDAVGPNFTAREHVQPEIGVRDIRRRRAFYIIDRTIPVGYENGHDYNAENVIRLRRFIEVLNEARPIDYPIWYSVGGARFDSERHAGLAELFEDADRNMYAAKSKRRSGRSTPVS